MSASTSKRTVAMGAGVVVSGIALVGGGALLLGPGAASAAPAAHKAAVTKPAAKPVAKKPTVAKRATPTQLKVLALKRAKAASAVPYVEDQDQKYRDEFYAAGYTYDDAVTLGKMWNGEDPWQVKADAGKKLDEGQTLPIKPGSSSPAPAAPETADDAAVDTFFAAGYTYDDAVKLAAYWHTSDPYEAKVEGGKKLENGETLPIAP